MTWRAAQRAILLLVIAVGAMMPSAASAQSVCAGGPPASPRADGSYCVPLGIGTGTPAVSLDLSWVTDAVALPVGTTGNRPAGPPGMLRYESDTQQFVGKVSSSSWVSFVTSASLGTQTPAAGSSGDVQFNSGGYPAGSNNLFWNNSNGFLGIGSSNPATLLSLGTSGGINGAIALNGSVSGEVLLTVGTAAGNAVKFQLPSSNGANGYVLQTDGTGITSWAVNSGSGASISLGTSVSVTNPARASEINTGLFSPASGAIGFASLGTEQMRITPGYIGIGTTAPYQALQVAGNVDSTGANGFITEIANDTTTGTTVNKLAKLTTSGKAIVTTTSDTDGVLGIVVGNAGTNGNAQMVISGQTTCAFDGATTAGDFVTISTTTAGDCHDAGSARPGGSQSIGSVLSTNASSGTYSVVLGLGGTTGGNVPTGAIAAFAATSCPTGWTEYTTARGRFLRGIDNGAGNDPDGTRSPGATQADMVGPHTHQQTRQNVVGSNYGPSGGYAAGFGPAGSAGSSDQPTTLANSGVETRPKNVAVTFCQYQGTAIVSSGVTASGTTNYVARWTSSTNIGTGVLYDNGSYVGIGTTAPGVLLDLEGNNVGNGGQIRISASDYDNISFYNSAATTLSPGNILGQIAYDVVGKDLYITNYNGGSFGPLLLNPGGGNVGIGTTAPQQIIHAYVPSAGSATLRLQNTAGTGNLQEAGATMLVQQDSGGMYLTSGGTSWNPNSDRRLKRDIQPLADEAGLAAIEHLAPVTFHWKNAAQDEKQGMQMGFIAQDVENIFPSLVQKAGSVAITLADGTTETVPDSLTLNYMGLITPLVKAIQELKANNDNLRADLKAANDNEKAEVNQLRRDIAELKQEVRAR